MTSKHQITIEIGDKAFEALQAYAANLFYDVSPYAVSRAVVSALLQVLDTESLYDKEMAAEEAMSEARAKTKMETEKLIVTQERGMELLKQEGLRVVKESKVMAVAKVLEAQRRPGDLKIPKPHFQGGASNTFLGWHWAMTRIVDSKTPLSFRFSVAEMKRDIATHYKETLGEKPLLTVIDTLVKKGWFELTRDTAVRVGSERRWTLTQAAQKWLLVPGNEDFLDECDPRNIEWTKDNDPAHPQ